MRVLLDENIDRRLKPSFDRRFTVATVVEHGWSGKKNGELLRAAEAEFDVLVTMDRSIEHQQNVSEFNLGILVVRAPSNRREDVAPLMPRINDALAQIRPGELVHIASGA